LKDNIILKKLKGCKYRKTFLDSNMCRLWHCFVDWFGGIVDKNL